MAAKFKFDGKTLKEGSRVIANVSGNNIRKESGSTTIANIYGNNIRQGTVSTTIANVSGDKIRQGTGSSTIGSMKDIYAAIEGPGGMMKSALWFVCIR